MSLKVWLPLNGDLENKGISNVNITANGASVNTSGKIGSCYSFDGSDDYISLDSSTFYDVIKGGTQPFSIAMWIYHNDSTRAILFGDYGLSGAIGFNIELTTAHQIRFYWNGSPDKNFDSNSSVGLQTWTHIILTYDGSQLLLYKNGTVISDKYSGALAAKTKSSGVYYLGRDSRTGTTALNGRLNDFRLYDHCLSALEVKEISQALVLHYKLDSKYIEGTTNLYSGTFSNTCYNGATNKYGYGTSTDIYKTTGFFQGKNSVKIYMGTAGLDAYPYIYFDAFSTAGTNIHTLSFDYYPTTQTSIIPYSYNGTYNISYITSNGDSNAVTNASQITIPVITNQWNHISITMQKYDTTNTSRGNGYIRIGSAKHTSTTTDYWLFANIQVEAKAYETGYTDPGTTRDNTIVQDSSGYNNNGTVTGELVLDSNSPRYSSGVTFTGTQRINRDTLGADIRTLSCWCKTTKNKSTSQHMVADSASGMCISFYQGNIIGVFGSVRSTGSKCILGDSYKENDWNHIVVIKTSDDGQRDIYCNGVKLTPTSNDYWGSAAGFYVGARNTSNGNAFYGQIADVRAYATQLLDNDVISLYNTGMKIDNQNNAHPFEINESNINKLTKSGILFDQIVEPYLTLSDGSKWKLMLYHYVDNGRRLFTSSNATYCNDLGLYSRLNEIANYSYDNKYEYYVIQDGKEFRWTQTSSPTAASISGLTTVSGYLNPVNGLAKSTSQTQTYIGYGSWWGACGCWTSYSTGGKTGIPGFGSHSADGICEDYLALYTRISDTEFKLKDELVEAAEFIER